MTGRQEEFMSHHGESPLALRYPEVDVCDLFVFSAAAGRTVFIQTLSPMSGPAGFHPRAVYEFNVDPSAGTCPELVFRVTFGQPNPGGGQQMAVRLVPGTAGREPGGELLAKGDTEAVVSGTRGTRAWAGRAADPFAIDPAVIGAVVRAAQNGERLDVPAVAAQPPSNLFANCEVNAIVLEVPDDLLAGAGPQNPGGISVWATTALNENGAWFDVQRCATPLIPTIFFSGDQASGWNAADPAGDRDAYGPVISNRAASAFSAAGGAGDPQAHGARVEAALLPDVLRYQPGTIAHFGFTGRNGRGLSDPAAEVMYAIVTGRAVPGLHARSTAAEPPRPDFPYLAAPLRGSGAPALAAAGT
jgi:hypothetical protein